MKTIISILFAFFLFHSGSVFAKTLQANCSQIDLRNQLGFVRDQGDKGWCFAEAAAVLLSYEFSKELENRQVSAIYIALLFYQHLFLGETEGGNIELSISFAQKHGLCPLSSNMIEYVNVIKERTSQIKTLKQQGNYKEYQRVFIAFLQDYHPKLWKVLKKSKMYSKDIMDFWKNVRNPFQEVECSEALVKVPKRKFYSHSWHIVSYLNQELTQNNVVGISIHANFLQHENTNAGPKDDYHAMVVIGRQWNESKSTCQYLLRNSWGPTCESYTSALQSQCEQGDIWVDEPILQKQAIKIVYFHSDKKKIKK